QLAGDDDEGVLHDIISLRGSNEATGVAEQRRLDRAEHGLERLPITALGPDDESCVIRRHRHPLYASRLYEGGRVKRVRIPSSGFLSINSCVSVHFPAHAVTG